MGDKILLVEGEADEGFYTAISREINLDVSIKVGRPIKFGGVASGKGNAINLLPTLIDQMKDGQINKLAMIIDADYDASHGLGIKKTLNQVTSILNANSYKISNKVKTGGYRFKHTDGLPDFGLWIMPNNTDDGLVEDFIKSTIIAAQIPLLNKAVRTVDSLKTPLFKSIHKSKADVATWMAWQEVPGQAMHGMVGGKFIDFTSGEAKNLVTWLRSIYK